LCNINDLNDTIAQQWLARDDAATTGDKHDIADVRRRPRGIAIADTADTEAASGTIATGIR